LFGDSITGDLPIVLLRTCGGQVARIKELILNKEAYEYSRGSAQQALSYAAMEGYISREEGLIHSGYVGYEEFSEVLKDGKEKCLENLREKIKQYKLDDIHESMEW
jgi:Protein of unknown function (DUF1186)